MSTLMDPALALLDPTAPPPSPGTVAERLRGLLTGGSLDLPLPGHGDTPGRWAALARWGRDDLPLARLAEGHTDALAILDDAGAVAEPGALYGVWAARSGGTGAELTGGAGARMLRGTVRFCSGAHDLDRALVVASSPWGMRLVDVHLDDPGVRPAGDSWTTVGMRASDTQDVEFHGVGVPDDALLGDPGFYTARPGFWWGGAGVAAVWLGGAAGVVDDVVATLRAGEPDPHQLAHVGALHTTLRATDALLARTAEQIDADPKADHRTAAWTARAAAERTCRTVLDLAPRTAGVAALSRGGTLAQRLADLGMYVRQHHGERDLAALGTEVLGTGVRATETRDVEIRATEILATEIRDGEGPR
ncbi:MAG: acyl-CoA/acyl-ACP dehydrogenase [Pseudonocardia sp.]|nr:acyl-CoA/acyl-ACP dehydrogenase [Pseudonocardia sp.]